MKEKVILEKGNLKKNRRRTSNIAISSFFLNKLKNFKSQEFLPKSKTLIFYKDIDNNDHHQQNVNVNENLNNELPLNEGLNLGNFNQDVGFRGKLVCYLDTLKTELSSDYRSFYDNQMNIINLLNEVVDSLLSQFNEREISEMDSMSLKSLCLEIMCSFIASRI